MSDIRFKYSPIGGGKTLHSIVEICQELERTERYIVTNCPVLLDDCPKGYLTFREYCDKWIKKPVDVGRRLAWLTKQQAVEFYRYLPAGHLTAEQVEKFGLTIHENIFERSGVVLARCRVAELPLRQDVVHGELVNFAARDRSLGCFPQGVHYFIDEAHKLYPARAYHKVSPRLEDYSSELRKLDDDLTLISQNPEKVDKNCRRNATEWLQVQNMQKTRLLMGVSLKGRFRWHLYQQADMPTRMEKPTISGWYQFDQRRKYHLLYLTMDGVGVSGGMVSEQNRFKGRSPWIYAVALAAILVAAWFLPRGISWVASDVIGGGIGRLLSGVTGGVTKNIGSLAPAPTPSPVPVSRPVPNYPVPSSVPALGAVPASFGGDSLYCRGWSRLSVSNMVFLFSDGTTARTDSGEVTSYGNRWVVRNGVRVPVKI